MRHYLVLLHRYVGLTMAAFLLIAGLTGSLIVWHQELDAAFNPAMLKATPPTPDAKPLDPLVLRDKVLAAYPQAMADYVPLRIKPDEAVNFYLTGKEDPKTHQHIELAVDDVYVNPYTGDITGARKWEDFSLNTASIMPFIYQLHYSLVLGEWGYLAMGIVALLWTLDCLWGTYLTFPAPQRKGKSGDVKPAGKSWLARWKPSWLVRWQGGSYKLNFDLHRAGALWLWLMLLVIAWSSVAYNLRSEVYIPVMHAAGFDSQRLKEAKPALAEEQFEPGLSWPQAREIGAKHMQTLARQHGLLVYEASALNYNHHNATFSYVARTSADVFDTRGQTEVIFDANSGRYLQAYLPSGHTAGDTVTNWLFALHSVEVWGLPYRLFMTVFGLAVAMLSVTGVYIWWKKRAGRQKAAQKQGQGKAAEPALAAGS